MSLDCLKKLILLLLLAVPRPVSAGAADSLQVPNGGFEVLKLQNSLPEGWTIGIGGGAKAAIRADNTTSHSGKQSLLLSNQSPLQAFVYGDAASRPIPVQPLTTYLVHFYARGKDVHGCHVAISFRNDGERRQDLPGGDFDWQPLSCQFTTPESCSLITLHFATDDITEALWIDDISIERSPLQLANLAEVHYLREFQGVFPRSRGVIARRLVVYDCSHDPLPVQTLLAVLEGLVNRRQPRLYLVNATNPGGYDNIWLEYMKARGYTGPEERVTTPGALLNRFRSDFRGCVLTDPELPGSINAACMLAGLENALPAPAELAETLHLPVIIDLRGRWRRNVDAYRYVYDHYWNRMSHYILAWIYPLTGQPCPRDYMVEFNIFCFWLSGYADKEKGADPPAEEAFINELLSHTPANIPVMGWPGYGDKKGIPEYTGVRWLSEFGKFMPGTEFCSNLSIHTAIHPRDSLFRQKSAPSPQKLEKDRVYIALNILDSGDGLWYWQFHQRLIWADPERGHLPIGWCTNITLYEAMPLVLQWYYENATPNDTFFAAVSGLGYMNTQAYAGRFRRQDRDRIWREYVQLTANYCRKLDIHGIELYNGGWGDPTPPSPDTFSRFVRGIKGLKYILADLGRHESITPSNANTLLGETAVFHTLTRFKVWSSSAEVYRDDMNTANTWLLEEIRKNSPRSGPAFMSAMAISWIYKPSWLEDLARRLPPEYVVVSPADLAALFRESRQ